MKQRRHKTRFIRFYDLAVLKNESIDFETPQYTKRRDEIKVQKYVFGLLIRGQSNNLPNQLLLHKISSQSKKYKCFINHIQKQIKNRENNQKSQMDQFQIISNDDNQFISIQKNDDNVIQNSDSKKEQKNKNEFNFDDDSFFTFNEEEEEEFIDFDLYEDFLD